MWSQGYYCIMLFIPLKICLIRVYRHTMKCSRKPKSTGMVYLFFCNFNWQLFFPVLYVGQPYLRPSKFGSTEYEKFSSKIRAMCFLSFRTVCYYFHSQVDKPLLEIFKQNSAFPFMKGLPCSLDTVIYFFAEHTHK